MLASRMIQRAWEFNSRLRVCRISFVTDSAHVRDLGLVQGSTIDCALRHLSLYFGLQPQEVTLYWNPREDTYITFADEVARAARESLRHHAELVPFHHVWEQWEVPPPLMSLN